MTQAQFQYQREFWLARAVFARDHRHRARLTVASLALNMLGAAHFGTFIGEARSGWLGDEP